MRKIIGVMAVVAFLVGCGGSSMSRQDILRYHSEVNQFNIEVADVEGKNGELLAPDGFDAVKALLDEAVDAALAGQSPTAKSKAETGLQKLEKVRADMKTTEEEFAEVLDTRDRAELEGAAGLFRDDFDSADSDFKDAARKVEQGNLAGAREARAELIKAYADLELRSLEKGKRAAAEAAIKAAEEADADDWAPKTFERAEAELKLVTSVLESDRTQKEKADAHAMKTIWLAGRAMAITQLAKMFDDGDYELEDVILWHQAQLDYINEPLKSELPFDQSDAAAVQALRVQVAGLLKSLADMRELAKKNEADTANQRKTYEKRIADILEKHAQKLKAMETASKSQLEKMQKEAADELNKAQSALAAEAEEKARYDAVGKLFADWEASVTRKDKNVLISVHAFDFKNRSTEIGAQNFGLLDKIVSAINKFPNSKIVVTGHTDARGGKDRNLRISIERAEAVARFLTTMGKIESSRVQATGEGENQPIASNDNSEGRAKNRRIEILIVNE